MKIEKGNIKFNSSRDVYSQKSFVLNENGKIVCEIVVCVTEEFFMYGTNPETKDKDQWFDKNTEELYSEYKAHEHSESSEKLIRIMPQLDVLYAYAESL